MSQSLLIIIIITKIVVRKLQIHSEFIHKYIPENANTINIKVSITVTGKRNNCVDFQAPHIDLHILLHGICFLLTQGHNMSIRLALQKISKQETHGINSSTNGICHCIQRPYQGLHNSLQEIRISFERINIKSRNFKNCIRSELNIKSIL